ncbi:MAG: S-layer homology domain-containing protein [Synergistaceae bacterium]|jgi:hypothetical protein|nr:S-layer homology domain-containing protein [Synergistaceae bacterium]
MKKFIIAAAVMVLTILALFAVPAFAATNPFMDVPASHWAYDAVSQLASRGVISGYPDGSYKGTRPATRYEMASVIARSLAQVDLEKASKQDVELLKRLIVEFKDELDALGVRVDGIDARLAVIERDLGGWSISGQLRFDANFGMNRAHGWYNDDMTQSGKNDFDLNRYRIFLNKRINDTTTFFARLGKSGRGNTTQPAARWDYYSITTKLGYGLTMTAGSINFDWEDEAGLVGANASLFGDINANAFIFTRDWGIANLQFVIARANDNKAASDTGNSWEEEFLLAAKANFDIAERLNAGVMAYYQRGDEDVPSSRGGLNNNMLTAGAYFSYSITRSMALKGLYYYQDQGEGRKIARGDNAHAWRVALDVDQDALKFTRLWLEYSQIDNNFIRNETPYAFNGVSLLNNQPMNGGTTKVYGVNTSQVWGDKWRTFLGYYHADFNTAGVDEANEWVLGVGYRLNPAVEFELSYNNINYGDTNPTAYLNQFEKSLRNGDDHQIRFRTFVSF